MQLFTPDQRMQLIENGNDPDIYYPPVAKLFLTNTECVWLISEICDEKRGLAFGLCDIGTGFPDLACCHLDKLQKAEVPDDGVYLVCDKTFKGEFPIKAYAEAARVYGRVVTDPIIVSRYCKKPVPR